MCSARLTWTVSSPLRLETARLSKELMHIDFKFRNLESSDAIKTYAVDKLGKLQKYLRMPLDAQVTFRSNAICTASTFT